jgi:hypothetical protein
MDLSSLVLRVRNNLSDIPLSYIDDSAVLNDLRRADDFVELIKRPEADEDKVKTGVEFLASYYSYMTWTTLSEKELGQIPYSTIQKALHLRSMARSYLQLISKFPLTEDLTVDLSKIDTKVPAFKLSGSIVEYGQRW